MMRTIRTIRIVCDLPCDDFLIEQGAPLRMRKYAPSTSGKVTHLQTSERGGEADAEFDSWSLDTRIGGRNSAFASEVESVCDERAESLGVSVRPANASFYNTRVLTQSECQAHIAV